MACVHNHRSYLCPQLSVVIILHMALAFQEGARLSTRQGSRWWLYLCNLACVVVYAMDAMLYWLGFCRDKPFGANLGVHASFAANLTRIRRRGYIRAGFAVRASNVASNAPAHSTRVQVAFGADLLVQYVTGYTTGPGDLATYIPYSALLRPVFLLTRSSGMRRAVSNFVQTLVLSRKVRVRSWWKRVFCIAFTSHAFAQVILLSLAFVSVATVTNVALMAQRASTSDDAAFIGATFGYVEAFFIGELLMPYSVLPCLPELTSTYLLDVFVFVSTGENYNDIVYSSDMYADLFVIYYMVREYG